MVLLNSSVTDAQSNAPQHNGSVYLLGRWWEAFKDYCDVLRPMRFWWLISLSQVNQNLGLAGQIRNGAGFEFFGRS
jgi:hypothetical protein